MISVSALGQTLLSLLVYDKDRAPALALRLDPRLFVGRSNQLIAQTAILYIKQYRKPPGEQIELLLEAELRRGEEGRFLGQTLNFLKEQAAITTPEFILDELTNWEESQKITIASQEAIEAVERGDLAGARKALNNSRSAQQEGSPGIWLSNPQAMFRAYDRDDSTDFFSSGVAAIDSLGTVPERKTLTCIMASTNKGKSWWLTEMLKAGIQFHQSGVLITLELSEEKAAQRLLQSIFALTKKEAGEVTTPYFQKTADGSSTTIEFRKLERDSIFNKRKELMQKLAQYSSLPPIVIKEFPTGRLTHDQLELYLDSLDKEFGLKPDKILIDAPHNMTMSSENLRLDTGRNWINLRGTAVARNAAVIGAAQGNRGSDMAKVVDKGDVAEDWSIMGTCDTAYTYSQTSAEYSLGLSRLLVAKSRNEVSRVMVLNSQAYSIGQFSLDSVIMQRGVAAEVERLTGE